MEITEVRELHLKYAGAKITLYKSHGKTLVAIVYRFFRKELTFLSCESLTIVKEAILRIVVHLKSLSSEGRD